MQTEYGLPCSLIVGCNERQEKVGKTIAHVSIVYNVIICHEIVAPGSKFKQKALLWNVRLSKATSGEKTEITHEKSLVSRTQKGVRSVRFSVTCSTDKQVKIETKKTKKNK